MGHMGQQLSRRDDLVIITVRASIQTQKLQVFFQESTSTEPECVNSAHADAELVMYF